VAGATLPLAFDVTTPVVFERRNRQNQPLAAVVIRNGAMRPLSGQVSIYLADKATGAPAKVALTPVSVPEHGLRKYDVSMTASTGAVGYVALETNGVDAAVAVRELRVAPELSTHVDDIAVGALVAGIVAVFIGIVAAAGRLKQHGEVVWSDSWGSNVSIGAGLLTAVLQLSIFPEQTHYLHRSAYSLLSVIFTALVALAPVVCGLFSKQTAAGREVPATFFCIAGVLTLWGGVGQLVVLGFAILELRDAVILPETLAWLLSAMTFVLLPVLCGYGIFTIQTALTPPSDKAGLPPAWRIL
jgi:hypothetical protein